MTDWFNKMKIKFNQKFGTEFSQETTEAEFLQSLEDYKPEVTSESLEAFNMKLQETEQKLGEAEATLQKVGKDYASLSTKLDELSNKLEQAETSLEEHSGKIKELAEGEAEMQTAVKGPKPNVEVSETQKKLEDFSNKGLKPLTFKKPGKN